MIVNISLKLVYPSVVGENCVIYGLQIIGKCIYILHMPPTAKFITRILSSHSRQKKITYTPRRSFETLCPSSKVVGGIYDVTLRPLEIICHYLVDHLPFNLMLLKMFPYFQIVFVLRSTQKNLNYFFLVF